MVTDKSLLGHRESCKFGATVSVILQICHPIPHILPRLGSFKEVMLLHTKPPLYFQKMRREGCYKLEVDAILRDIFQQQWASGVMSHIDEEKPALCSKTEMVCSACCFVEHSSFSFSYGWTKSCPSEAQAWNTSRFQIAGGTLEGNVSLGRSNDPSNWFLYRTPLLPVRYVRTSRILEFSYFALTNHSTD